LDRKTAGAEGAAGLFHLPVSHANLYLARELALVRVPADPLNCQESVLPGDFAGEVGEQELLV
ncbi:MAG TPA: hypothetical protein DCQ94_12010, partial [Nitrospira sp.]|nr:hypothetical protein [Nitrospira sp.]